MTKSKQSEWVQRLMERSRAARLLLAFSALVGAITTIGVAGRAVYNWYDTQFRRDDKTTKILESLRPNVRVDDFDSRLGRPRITTSSDSGTRVQHLYQGRGYWVQAVADRNGTVQMFAVTVCDQKLRPTWRLWNSTNAYGNIRLNSTKIVNNEPLTPSGYVWFLSGATANSYFYAVYGGGNPTNYQNYAWGYNDACLDNKGLDQMTKADIDAFEGEFAGSGTPSDNSASMEIVPTLPSAIHGAFSHITANTFAIFGIFEEPADLIQDFQIGADRILTRTLTD